MRKIIRNNIAFLLLFVLVLGCNEGIDTISEVKPGNDETAPQINIKYPVEGTQIQIAELVASIDIKFEVTDDIEINKIQVFLDNNELASYSDFKDYRRFIQESLVFDEVANGQHTLKIVAVDIDGKTTMQEVHFEKVPPYIPLYNGEVFYMPFNNDYMEMISFKNANIIGNPDFAGESIIKSEGENAYKGAADSYLTFPTEGLFENDMSAVFWMKVNPNPNRAGVLVVGPIDESNPNKMNNRKKGFRFFREQVGKNQRFKLNVGTGDSDAWFDGGSAADVNPAKNEWVHFAFTISGSEAIVYINGQIVKQGELPGIDWSDTDIISIMSGAPRFNGWNHNSDLSYMDELRLFNRVLSKSEIVDIIETESGKVTGYQPKYDGEIFYMPFDEDYKEKITGNVATKVGNPELSDVSMFGKSYKGAADSYISFPATSLQSDKFSASFWYKINAEPNRAGILVMGPVDKEKPDKMNNRKNGFRLFREGDANKQYLKLNVGTGDSDAWFDGGDATSFDPALDEWVHVVFTISESECVIYFNGEVVKQGEYAGVNWTGCDLLSIGSGAPRFTEWNHLSDNSLLDELRIFNKVLSKEEVEKIYTDK